MHFCSFPSPPPFFSHLRWLRTWSYTARQQLRYHTAADSKIPFLTKLTESEPTLHTGVNSFISFNFTTRNIDVLKIKILYRSKTKYIINLRLSYGVGGGVVGSVTALQAGRSRVRFWIVSFPPHYDPGSTLTEMGTRNISWRERRPVHRADKLTTFMCRLPWNPGASTSCISQGLSRPAQGLLYFYVCYFCKKINYLLYKRMYIYIYIYMYTRIGNIRSKINFANKFSSGNCIW